MNKSKSNIKIISQNKRAYYDYFIEEIFQAGIELLGTEVKSLRQGRCNLKDSFIRIDNKQAFLNNMHISPYDHGNIFNRDPLRNRRLLLHGYEINKLHAAVTRNGFTIVPLKIYFKGSLVKIDIAIAKGKKIYDKRRDIAKKDMQREAEKEFKIKNIS